MADAPARIKQGPLSGKRVGLLAGPEFSDFQAYYLNLYLSELGARVCNLVIGWPEVGWKMTRPATSDTVQGTFGLRLDPIPTMAHGDRYTTLVFRDQAQLSADFVGELDALIVLGGHSADVLRVDPAVTGFVSSAYRDGVLVGALECGQMVLMSAGVIDGQRVTGYRVVRPFLSRLGTFVDAPVVVDGNLITARDSDATPRFARAIALVPARLGRSDRRPAGRQAHPDRGRPGLRGRGTVRAGDGVRPARRASDPRPSRRRWCRARRCWGWTWSGNFGMSVPFQELDDCATPALTDLGLGDFDAVMIPGAFCPWNCLDDGSPVELCWRAAAAGKVVAAICHGPLVLAAADLVDGRRIAGFTACRDDVITMGARYDFAWPAMIDGNIVTGRVPDDVPEFVDAITDALSGSRLLQAATPAFAEVARAAP